MPPEQLWGLLQGSVTATVSQLAGVLGVFFIFGTVLYWLERLTTVSFLKTIGWKGVLLTAWLGTPIHELGHAFFCLVFGHKIRAIKLYQPDEATGMLGYVAHEYHPNNIVHQIGNFFIGAAPLIIGCAAMYAALYFLVPNSEQVIAATLRKSQLLTMTRDVTVQGQLLLNTGIDTLKLLFTQSNLYRVEFWIFLYIALCIASHIAPSPADMRRVWGGLAAIVGVMLLINFIAQLSGSDITRQVLSINYYLGIAVAMFVFSTVISLANFLFFYLLLSIYAWICYRSWLNPFTVY
ncbi:MAG: hypothetical protein KDI38_08800 [Calditrichaeota bacterium]|nr:hypothetical protein [Calditrichota bacterium]MCB0303865.1 hypothetical protein [Calditrichota bacterium]MCB0314217.1 hypothetical protein [Calditrichota bacterium]MCB9087055.1 hypothetical protein [Calditrichia bacterium]